MVHSVLRKRYPVCLYDKFLSLTVCHFFTVEYYKFAAVLHRLQCFCFSSVAVIQPARILLLLFYFFFDMWKNKFPTIESMESELLFKDAFNASVVIAFVPHPYYTAIQFNLKEHFSKMT